MHTDILLLCSIFSTPSRRALERAKQNVDQHYSVVGIIEDLYNFLVVLEHRMPQLFRGISKNYLKLGKDSETLFTSFSPYVKFNSVQKCIRQKYLYQNISIQVE